MAFDIGVGEFLQRFEQRYGKRATDAAVLVVMLAVLVVSLRAIIKLGVIPLYELISAALPHAVWPEANGLTLLYAGGVIALLVLLYPAFSYFSQYRRVPQGVVDQLAVLRKTAVDDLLNGSVATPQELVEWKHRADRWRASVHDVLEKHFPKSEVLGFDSLGVLQPVSFPHAFNNEHSFQLSMLAKRLSVLEDIIRRHTR